GPLRQPRKETSDGRLGLRTINWQDFFHTLHNARTHDNPKSVSPTLPAVEYESPRNIRRLRGAAFSGAPTMPDLFLGTGPGSIQDGERRQGETVHEERRERDHCRAPEEERRIATQFSATLFHAHRGRTGGAELDQQGHGRASRTYRREGAQAFSHLAAFSGLHRLHGNTSADLRTRRRASD